MHRSAGLSESGRTSSRLHVGSRPNESNLSGPLFQPSTSQMSTALSMSPRSLQVDMDTPANKLLKMMDGIMSGQGVLLEDALAIQVSLISLFPPSLSTSLFICVYVTVFELIS